MCLNSSIFEKNESICEVISYDRENRCVVFIELIYHLEKVKQRPARRCIHLLIMFCVDRRIFSMIMETKQKNSHEIVFLKTQDENHFIEHSPCHKRCFSVQIFLSVKKPDSSH